MRSDSSISTVTSNHLKASSVASLPLEAPGLLRPLGGVRQKARAAGVHLALSGVVAVVVLAVVMGGWYPAPMHAILGVGTILGLMLVVDVLLGPVLTFVVYDPRKARLWIDLALIGLFQVGALIYGVYTVEQGRPAFVVLAQDRFEVVAPSELRREDLAASAHNPVAQRSWLTPKWVSARQPESARERLAIGLEAAATGRDVQHYPRLYVDYADDRAVALKAALPIARLRELNPQAQALIDKRVRQTGLSEARLRYLPMRGPARDGAVFLDWASGRVVGMVLVQPW